MRWWATKTRVAKKVLRAKLFLLPQHFTRAASLRFTTRVKYINYKCWATKTLVAKKSLARKTFFATTLHKINILTFMIARKLFCASPL